MMLYGNPLESGVNIEAKGNFDEMAKMLLAMALYKKELALLLKTVVSELDIKIEDIITALKWDGKDTD